MCSSELKREENYNEFLRLSLDKDYVNVTYDEKSGGVSAVHKLHKFDKQRGIFGVRRGDYELAALDVLRKGGHRIVLEAESNTPGIKSYDGFLDDEPMDIKAIEGSGTWTISTKLRNSAKQKAQCVVLYFPKKDLYSQFRVSEGIRLLESSPDKEKMSELSRILVVVEDHMITDWDKKATPI